MKIQFRKTPLLASVVLVMFAIAGCAEVGDKASSAASSAASHVAELAKKELITAVCAPLKDGTINASELKVLSSMVDAVREGGLPKELVNALDGVAGAGDNVPADAQARLVTACDNSVR
ncbi:hypothetical protein CQ018_17525 [Arthrobacter sp. MYb227]|uniref:hypothetical protein n=1 Tax=Arthrobacter sp. MYb227 TaxID=1848601 RepID=UPI000CFE1B65|nr:hypothetical protein [Arthrobacter sp. MYb227]PQZ87744.1 hypothetical protein CQ018_17525 [Arthrobacter sp. MYb227]